MAELSEFTTIDQLEARPKTGDTPSQLGETPSCQHMLIIDAL